ncbi:uncharacterized protein LOC134193224 [Corticium candelabrum]|uniref:uncharacterized protein LOC134193224 n=1 Tax=Corticium candelabrum TaxID=121492 RepID=UPI002E26FC5E|nr:uncharacterized protein LOC134193224 [Corticium candelabrum]
MNKPNATQKIKTKPDHRQSRDQQASHKFTVSVQNYIEMQSVVVNDIQLRVQELKVQQRKSHAKVFIIENFLSQHEMQSLVKAHDHHSTDLRIPPPLFCFDGVNTLQAHLDDAGIKYTASDSDFTAGTYCVNSTFSHRLKHVLKWSVSTAFYTGESKFSWILQDRIFKATGLKPENGGKYQLTSYSEGVGYKTHTDCVLNDEKRDRYGTFLVYLEDVEEGGETRFPQLDIAVKPKAGRALIWNSMDAEGNCDPMTVHSADKVARGRKVILQRWYYYHNFPALGKRMSEPDLPVRLPHQPMVQCDQYDSGSCRWYDEWGYGHLREYRQMNQNNQL